MSASRQMSDYEQKIVDDVDEYGCFVTGVFDPEGIKPDYSYSVGFSKTLGQGEVIIFGLSHDLMHKMINALLEVCEKGVRLEDGARIPGILGGFDVVARSVAPVYIVTEYFNSAMWFHTRTFRKPLSSAFQIVWPGAAQGLFPWEEGCDEYVISQQPPLYKTSLH